MAQPWVAAWNWPSVVDGPGWQGGPGSPAISAAIASFIPGPDPDPGSTPPGTEYIITDPRFIATVQGWVDGTYDNYGIFIVNVGTEDNGAHFLSSEAQAVLPDLPDCNGLRPSLEVTYYVP